MEKKILILEDEKEVAQLYAKCLNGKGYITEIAFNGVEGLEKLKKFTPHLILTDVNMPKMGGLEFYQHICDPKKGPKFPVIVLTARGDLENLFKDFQVSGFLVKPFGASLLLKEVDSIFNKNYVTKTHRSVKKIIIVEDIQESAKKIASVFSNAGYKTDIACSGVAGIEKIVADQPDLSIIKLGLFDIPGDKVILRLQQMARTKENNAMLYIPQSNEQERMALENISRVRGIKHHLEYNDPVDLLNEANVIFQESEHLAPQNLN